MSAVFLTVQALLANATVTGVTSTRVQPFPLKQGTALPAIAIAMSNEEEEMMLAGSSQYPNATVQVHCVATTASDVIRLGEKVKGALRDLLFYDSNSPSNGGSFTKDALDFTDFSDDLTTFRRVMGYSLRWRGAVTAPADTGSGRRGGYFGSRFFGV